MFDVAANPGWTYDPATRVATYTKTSGNSYAVGNTGRFAYNMSALLKLRFPGADTSPLYTNTATATWVPVNAQPYEDVVVYTDPITFKLTTVAPNPLVSKSTGSVVYDQDYSKQQLQLWSLTVQNRSIDVPLTSIVWTDHTMDPRLEYVYITQASNYSSQYTGTFSIYAWDAAGAKTPVVTDATFASVPPTAPRWDFPAGTVKFTIESDAESGIRPNTSVAFTLATRIKDPDNVHWTGTAADTFRNSISFTGRLDSINTTVIGSATGSFTIRKYDPRITLAKTMGTTSLLVGQKSTAALALSYGGGQTMLAPDRIEGQQLIDLLPHGLVYDPAVRPSLTVWGNAANSAANLFVSLTPEIVPNYKGSGRTALVWTFKNPIEANTSSSVTPIITLNFGVIATRDLPEGQNTNEARFIWNNNRSNPASTGQQVVLVNPTTGGIADTFDFDGDGNTTELIARTSQSFLFTPPRELIGQKAVKGNLDADFCAERRPHRGRRAVPVEGPSLQPRNQLDSVGDGARGPATSRRQGDRPQPGG